MSSAFVIGPELLARGRAASPLSARTAAVKDVFDIAGYATAAGNPDWAASHPIPSQTATAVTRLVDGGASVLGKTVTDELAFSLAGTNVHYGMPPNPAAPGRVPGGSSSGSASAVATRLVDIGLGTDTAGSIRVPASYCGIIGVRPTWGRVPLNGCVPLAPGYDTAGWLTTDITVAQRVATALLDAWDGTPVAFEAMVVATDAFALTDPGVATALRPAVELLGSLVGSWREEALAGGNASGAVLGSWAEAFRVSQAHQVWRTHGPWITEIAPRMGPGVAARFGWAAAVTDAMLATSRPVRRAARRRLENVLAGGVLCLPAAAGPAPAPGLGGVQKDDLRARTLCLTCAAALVGGPSVSLPAGTVDGFPVNVALVSAPGTDELLLALSSRYLAQATSP